MNTKKIKSNDDIWRKFRNCRGKNTKIKILYILQIRDQCSFSMLKKKYNLFLFTYLFSLKLHSKHKQYSWFFFWFQSEENIGASNFGKTNIKIQSNSFFNDLLWDLFIVAAKLIPARNFKFKWQIIWFHKNSSDETAHSSIFPGIRAIANKWVCRMSSLFWSLTFCFYFFLLDSEENFSLLPIILFKISS